MIEDLILHWKSLEPTQVKIIMVCGFLWLFFGIVSVKLLALIDNEEVEED